jgi:hypothetical protein
LQTPSLPPEFAGAIFGARQTIFIDELFGFHGSRYLLERLRRTNRAAR